MQLQRLSSDKSPARRSTLEMTTPVLDRAPHQGRMHASDGGWGMNSVLGGHGEIVSLSSLGQLESEAIAIIGYQLWTPLSTIQACLELLEIPIKESSQRSMLELALQETVMLEELIRECLALFSPVEPGDDVIADNLQVACPLMPSLDLLRAALIGGGASTFPLSTKGKVCQQDTLVAFFGGLQEGYKASNSIESADSVHPAYFEQLRHKLIAIVGHELRTPLCSLRVCLETFTNESEQFSMSELQPLLEVSRSDISRLHQLVQQFFMLSRLEKGLIRQEKGVVDLRKTLELVSIGLNTQQCDLPVIRVDIPGSLPMLQVDEDKLVLALTQLLDNARQFTEVEDTISIEARQYAPPSQGTPASHSPMVEIIVADTGRGIDPNRLDKIFDCFYQEEDYLRRTVGGTGIGLAICRKLIEAMGGKIWAQSLGKALGSRIHMLLPTEGQSALTSIATI